MRWYEHWFDYTGTISDMLMAASAVGAYFLARDYFSDVIKKDGYELVKKLHLELIPRLEINISLPTINVLDIEVQNYIQGGNGVLQDEDEESNLYITLKKDLKILKLQLKESYILDREIKKLIEDLDIYGWGILEKKKIELIDVLEKTKILFVYIHNISITLNEILLREAPEFLPTNKDKKFLNYANNNPNSPPSCQKIELLCSKLVHYQRALYDHQNSTPYDQAESALRVYLKGGRHLKNYFKYESAFNIKSIMNHFKFR